MFLPDRKDSALPFGNPRNRLAPPRTVGRPPVLDNAGHTLGQEQSKKLDLHASGVASASALWFLATLKSTHDSEQKVIPWSFTLPMASRSALLKSGYTSQSLWSTLGTTYTNTALWSLRSAHKRDPRMGAIDTACHTHGKDVHIRQVPRLAKLWYGTYADPDWHSGPSERHREFFRTFNAPVLCRARSVICCRIPWRWF